MMVAAPAAASESALYHFMALASMGAVVLYFVLQTVYAIMDRLTAAGSASSKPPAPRQGRRPPPPPQRTTDTGAGIMPTEEQADNDDHQEEQEDKDKDKEAAEVDHVGTLLQRVWPAGHVAWTTDARWQPVRRLVPVLPNLIALLVTALLVYWFMAGVWSSTGTAGDYYGYAGTGGGDAGIGGDASVLGSIGDGLQWLGDIPYVLETYEVHGQLHRMPVVDCAFATEASRVQDKLLGPAPTGPAAGTGAGVDVDLELRLNRERSYLGELRQKATRRCLLRNETMLDAMTTEARWIQRAALAARVPPMPEATGRVTSVLLARNGTRYMRVLTTRASATPEPVVVAETTLLDAVRDWHARFLALAKRNLLVYPCICPAHLGIVNSGLHFYYDYEPPAQIGVDKARRGQWHVLYDVQLTPAVDELDDVDMAGFYREYMTRFPLDADAPFNVSSQTHAAVSHVHAVDTAALLRTELGAARLRDAEPMWVMMTSTTTPAAAAAAPTTPYAAVVDLQTLTLGDDSFGMTKGLPNACFHHCRALEPPSRAPSAMAVRNL